MNSHFPALTASFTARLNRQSCRKLWQHSAARTWVTRWGLPPSNALLKAYRAVSSQWVLWRQRLLKHSALLPLTACRSRYHSKRWWPSVSSMDWSRSMVSSVVMRSAAAGNTVRTTLTRWFSSMRKREEWAESNGFSSTFTSRQTAPSAVSTTLLPSRYSLL